jgi:membrane protein implicated in regulation of membrane protease activity
MIVSAISLAILIVLAVIVAGGFLLRVLGRLAVLAGLLGASIGGDPLGLLVAVIGVAMVAAGGSRGLDRRRRHA